MAKVARQRVAEYRARRRAKRLCIEAGCPNRVAKHARCQEHRELATERRQDRQWASLDEHQRQIADLMESHRGEIAKLERAHADALLEIQDLRARLQAANRAC